MKRQPTPDEQWEAVQRLKAAWHRRDAAAHQFAAAMCEASIAIRDCTRIIEQHYDEQLFTHPDVQDMDLEDAAWNPGA